MNYEPYFNMRAVNTYDDCGPTFFGIVATPRELTTSAYRSHSAHRWYVVASGTLQGTSSNLLLPRGAAGPSAVANRA